MKIELTTIPPFLRFNNVYLYYLYGAIVKNRIVFESQLLHLKPALIDSNMIDVRADIGGYGDFNDHSQFLDHIQNRLLPSCDSSRGYKFFIRFYTDANFATNVIFSLLKMAGVNCCPNVEISIIADAEMQLPVEEISNWLERSTDGIENKVQNQKEISPSLLVWNWN